MTLDWPLLAWTMERGAVGASRSWGRQGDGSSPEASRRDQPWDTVSLGHESWPAPDLQPERTSVSGVQEGVAVPALSLLPMSVHQSPVR